MRRMIGVRWIASLACGSMLCASLCVAQQSECAVLSRDGDDIVLTANTWNPALAIARTIMDKYELSISVESPQWDFPADTEDVAVANPEFSATHKNVHYRVMKRHEVRVRFPRKGPTLPEYVPTLLHQIADAANSQMPYGYRVDVSGTAYALVPTQTRDSLGNVHKVEPLLDRHVTIPEGTRPIAEHAMLMAEELSKQTGMHISCCQSFVGGIPWGMAKVSFGATDKPAREVLKTLIEIEDEGNMLPRPMHARLDHWIVRCDGTGAPWCFIELEQRFGRKCW